MIFIKPKLMFFDSQTVIRSADKATRRVLSRFGAFVRQEARQNIRRRRQVSRPGQAPTSWTGLLRRGILFGYDRQSRSVVIGPKKLNKSSNAPSILEYGGVTTLLRKDGQRRVTIAPRPYIGPAMQKELPKLPALWRNSIK